MTTLQDVKNKVVRAYTLNMPRSTAADFDNRFLLLP